MIWKRLGIPLLFLSLGLAIGLVAGRWSVRTASYTGRLLPHYNNSARARSIKPGTALSHVIQELGDPVGNSQGWLLFSESPNSRTIRVKVGTSGLFEAIDPGVD